MLHFDVILRINWLSPNYASMDCHYKNVKFEYPRVMPFYIHRDRNMASIGVVSVMTTHRLMRLECQGFLVVVLDT